MVVMEKRKDIAILLSMGATRASIRKIFSEELCDWRGRHVSRHDFRRLGLFADWPI
jgi:hypothetical protein